MEIVGLRRRIRQRKAERRGEPYIVHRASFGPSLDYIPLSGALAKIQDAELEVLDGAGAFDPALKGIDPLFIDAVVINGRS